MSAKKVALQAVVIQMLMLATVRGAVAQPSVTTNTGSPTSREPVVAAMAMASRASRAPLIDGRDDDDLWRSVPAITGFRLFDPIEDGEPTLRTEARDHLRRPRTSTSSSRVRPAARTASSRSLEPARREDGVGPDQAHDRLVSRPAHRLRVRREPCRREARLLHLRRQQEDVSWDAVWDVATRIDSLGWTAEFRIPFSQLRYAPAPEHTFGIMIVRDIARRNER